MTRNYEGQKFFNYSSYKLLCGKIGAALKRNEPNAQKMMDTIEKHCASAFLSYVTTVDMCETRITIAYNRMEGEDLRDAIQTIDAGRHAAHEAAIVGCSILNRMAAANNFAPIFTGNVDDRLQVADFCLEFTVEIFKNRRQ